MDSEPKTSPEHPGEDDSAAVARAEADLAAVQAAQTDQPPARPKVAPPSESPGRNGAAGGPSSDAGAENRRPRGELGREVDVLAARVEGMAVTMRDMARVALAAVLLAVVALLVCLYVLQAIRGAQSA